MFRGLCFKGPKPFLTELWWLCRELFWGHVIGRVTLQVSLPFRQLNPLFNCCDLGFFGQTLKFILGLLDRYKIPGIYYHVSIQHCLDLSSARMSFPGTLKNGFFANFKKVARGCAPCRTSRLFWARGDTPLKIPRCVYFSPQARRKTAVFLNGFRYSSIWLNFTIIILTLFAQVMVSKASVTNYGA